MAKQAKKSDPKLCRCYISAEKSAKLTGGEGMGEGFYINKTSPTTATVSNILMCGLGVGDEIIIQEYGDDGEHHPNEFVKVKKKVCEVCHIYYKFEGMETAEQLTAREQAFIHLLEMAGIKFEGMVKGMAAMQRPLEMTEENFLKVINSGPFQFYFDKETKTSKEEVAPSSNEGLALSHKALTRALRNLKKLHDDKVFICGVDDEPSVKKALNFAQGTIEYADQIKTS